MIEFTIPGDPRGKGRPRVVRLKNGASMSYTPDKTVAYEELARPSVEDFFCCLDKQAGSGSGISTGTIHKLRKIAVKEGFLEG